MTTEPNAQPTRRAFLKAAGVTLALPWLESWPLTRRARAEDPRAGEPPVRLVYVYTPNGYHMQDWRPPGEEGSLGELPWLLEPLAPWKSELLVLSGLGLKTAYANGDGPGDHARACAAYLTCRQPKKTGGADIQVGISADQVAARQIGRRTKFPSLEVGCERSRLGGSCDSGYSCAYSSNLSWKSPSQPLAKEIVPRKVFERLFLDGAGLTPEERERRRKRRQSVLDAVNADARDLAGRLGGKDKEKLDEYLTSVRELELRLARAEEEAPPPELELPRNTPRDFAAHIGLMYDLVALAFEADLTRVATFLVANEGSNRSYRQVGVREGHHHLSHHRGNKGMQEKVRQINRFHTERFAGFLERLSRSSGGAGADGEPKTLLDQTMVVLGSGIADGNRHAHYDLPILIAGRGGGSLTPGRHLVYPRRTPLANLHRELIQRVGAPVGGFGDSTGGLPRLLLA